jgi:hypothetical protein
MRSFIFLAVMLFSFPAFAGKVSCGVTKKGAYNNTVILDGKVVIEDHWSEPNDFTLALVSKLNFNFFGEQKFVAKGLHFSKDTQIDFDHETSNGVRALLLVQKTPGEVYEDRFFDGTLIVTGMNVKVESKDFPIGGWRYLIMNLHCELE